jgi:hypothetical protein
MIPDDEELIYLPDDEKEEGKEIFDASVSPFNGVDELDIGDAMNIKLKLAQKKDLKQNNLPKTSDNGRSFF